MKIALAWSRARTHHAANIWLRQKLVEACADLRQLGARPVSGRKGAAQSMIPKSGNRFSEKIMLET
jgi:hypothetical protein